MSNHHKKLVWDLPLRLFHWLFAVFVFAAWYTAEQKSELIELHMLLGYFLLGLVIFRILWGFVGTRHSRFSSFFPTPSRLVNYFKSFASEQPIQYTGHNPAGSLMVLLMIILILMQSVSGLYMSDDVFSSGPYQGSMGDEFDQAMKFIHYNVFDVMIGAIALHIAVVFYYRIKKKRDLITPMVTGKKPVHNIDNDDAITSSRILLAVIIALLVAAFVYWLVVVNAPVEEAFYY